LSIREGRQALLRRSGPGPGVVVNDPAGCSRGSKSDGLRSRLGCFGRARLRCQSAVMFGQAVAPFGLEHLAGLDALGERGADRATVNARGCRDLAGGHRVTASQGGQYLALSRARRGATARSRRARRMGARRRRTGRRVRRGWCGPFTWVERGERATQLLGFGEQLLKSLLDVVSDAIDQRSRPLGLRTTGDPTSPFPQASRAPVLRRLAYRTEDVPKSSSARGGSRAARRASACPRMGIPGRVRRRPRAREHGHGAKDRLSPAIAMRRLHSRAAYGNDVTAFAYD